MKSVAVIFFLSFIALVLSQNFAQIGTFEGTYKDNYYGGYLYLCQNGNVLQGSYSQVGIINGVVSNGVATGRFYQAGYNDCSLGTFTWTLTDEGFTGYFTCNGISGNFNWIAPKLDVFRPTNDQCALLFDGASTFQGHWTLPGTSYSYDLCIELVSDTNPYSVIGSYTHPPSGNNYPTSGLITGFSAFNDKIFLGTWYEDQLGGAALGYLNLNQELVLSFWNGLAGRQGASIIDSSEYLTPYHTLVIASSPQKTSYAQCERFSFLKTLVLDYLADIKDGNEQYIYFAYNPDLEFNVEVGFEPVDYKDSQYLQNYLPNSLINSSNYLTLSIGAVIIALLSAFI